MKGCKGVREIEERVEGMERKRACDRARDAGRESSRQTLVSLNGKEGNWRSKMGAREVRELCVAPHLPAPSPVCTYSAVKGVRGVIAWPIIKP